ncbi:MAG: bifunctional oligoribonuclease/PAP phosphatase NrnA [Lachnospiraceae bacterium]|nr:bifunctional oligoribonuclease/PAP phosphatase NrnA [Lachnospiraceae bacterium]
MNILQECMNAKRIGISGHIRPDGDCVGSCLALWQYLKKALPDAEVIVFLEKPADIFSELTGYELIDSTFEEQEPFDVFFALDCGAERLGEAQKYFEGANKKINIDHHISNAGCGDISVVRPEVGSVCEVLYDLMDKNFLDRDMAMALYIGIIHDTGVFQYSNVRPETLTTAAHLISYGFNFPGLIEETFYQRTYVQTQIMGRALMESVRFMDGRCIVSVVDKKTMGFYEVGPKDLDGIVNQLRNIKGVDCAIFMYETDCLEYKVSMRSNEKVDVAKVASYFKGGGHARAAGCTMKGTFHDCVNNLSLHIEEQLKNTTEE